MIKINLLPTKKKTPKKVTELQQQMILGALILGLVGAGMFFYWQSLSSRINDLQRSKAAAEAKIREQDNLLKEVKSVEDERRQVNDKIAIIQQLKKNQSGFVHLLDEVSKALPTGVNITALAENRGQISIEGGAFTNNDVVHFIDNLKASPYLADVFLLETREVVEQGIEMYKYKLQFTFKGA
jgi:type IV pilus assembly protein PilN